MKSGANQLHRDSTDEHKHLSNTTVQSVLSTWIAFEALTPQSYLRPEDLVSGDRKCISKISVNSLPWDKKEAIPENKNLYYQIILGSILMPHATEALIKVFGDDEEEIRRPHRAEKAVIAAILVDSNGILVGEKNVAISSFSWALHYALQQQLEVLATWPQIEPNLVSTLKDFFISYDHDGNLVPVTSEMIASAWEWIKKKLHLSTDMIENPCFAIRVYQHKKIKTHPEVSLLNSFFIDDLYNVLNLTKNDNLPVTLKKYLGLNIPTYIKNLLTDQFSLSEAILPQHFPTARWPTKGGHPLVVL